MPHTLGERAVGVVHTLCGGIAGHGFLQPFVAQIARVLCRIVPEECLPAVQTSEDVMAAFASKGLTPPVLVDAFLDKMPGGVSAQVGAMIFAACLYPQRAWQTDRNTLGLRAEAFQAAWSKADSPLDALMRRLPPDVPADGVAQMAQDLSGADLARHDADRQSRRDGGVLYLMTCTPDEIRRMLHYWSDDAAFVRQFRRWVLSAPSCLAMTNAAGDRPDWEQVQAWLARHTPLDDGARRKAVNLEVTARGEARKWVKAPLVPQAITSFWDFVCERLTCGFPYYAFRSHFAWWWRQYLRNYRFSGEAQRQMGYEPCETLAAEPDARPKNDFWAVGLSPTELRWFREGYRLVRTTFFRRADRERATSNEVTDAANDGVRRVLDDIWYHRLETKMGMDEQLLPETIKHILEKHPGTPEQSIHTLCRRLRLRIWSYALARLGRLRNSQILSCRDPRRADRHPLAEEPGVLVVASLARMVPPEDSLLWAFTSHAFLYPMIVPQRPDPWPWSRYIRELWFWVSEETFEKALRHGAERGSLPDRAAVQLMQDDLFKQLLDRLRTLEGPEQVEQYVTGQALHEHRKRAADLLSNLVGRRGLQTCDASFLAAGRTAETNHWMVPVWYLAFVEQLAEAEALARLCIDETDEHRVRVLWAAMTRPTVLGSFAVTQRQEP